MPTLRSARRVLLALPFAALTALPAQQFDVVETDIAGVHAALRAGRTSCRAVVQAYLDRIAAYDKAGPALNAIQHVNARALHEADSLDAARRGRQPMGPLHCVPVLLKDQIETRDMPTTYGSVLFRDFTPTRDATSVQRLEAAGAIILAKATMGEFAQRYVGSGSGIIRNAYDPTRNPSGSSGGTGTGVAANFGLVGIGEDTGGSIRGPAAVNSLVGLRPTLALVSRFGMMPSSPTQDTMGPMTRTVADAARVLDVIAGYDPNDPITAESVGRVPASYLAALKPDALRGVRLGVLRQARDSNELSRDSAGYAAVRAVFDRALEDLRAAGAVVVDSLTLPSAEEGGVGNSYETEEATDAYLAQHPGAPVRTLRGILLSGDVNPWRARSLIGNVGRSTREIGYLTVLRQRETLRVNVLKLMADHRLSALVYATFDAPPTPIADDVLTNPRPRDAYGRGGNRGLSPAIGFPALTVPAGFSDGMLPVGLELLGRPYSEAELLAMAYAYEQRTKHRRPPPSAPRVPAAPSR